MIKDKTADYIDHTNLKMKASDADLDKLVAEAQEHKFNSICIRSNCVKDYSSQYKVSATLSFPNKIYEVNAEADIAKIKDRIGTASIAAKISEAKLALKDGAKELDPVVSLKADIKAELEAYIELLNQEENEVWLKPIFSCELQTYTEITECIKAFVEASAKAKPHVKMAFKNSTGFIKKAEELNCEFNTTSEKLVGFIADELDKYDPGKTLTIKAAGGIKTPEQAEAIIAVAKGRLSHIGTSSGVDLLS